MLNTPNFWQRRTNHPSESEAASANLLHSGKASEMHPARRYLPVFDPAIHNSPTLGVTPREWTAHPLHTDFLFENTHSLLTVELPAPKRSWQISKNPAFTLILDGHLYLRHATTTDAVTNLEQLLHCISVRTVKKGLQEIAGGVYNLFIIDKEHQRVIITGDRFALMPLFYLTTPNGFYCSGNAFSFRRLATISEEALVEFLKYGYLPFAHSIFLDVKRRLPGQVIEVSLETRKPAISLPQIYEFKPPEYRITDLPTATEFVHRALTTYFSRMPAGDYFITSSESLSSRLVKGWLKAISPAPAGCSVLPGDASLPGDPAECSPEWFDPISDTRLNRFRLMLSMEHAGIFGVAAHPGHQGNAYFIDELIGEDIMGGGYLLPSATAQPDKPVNPNTPIRHITYYQKFLYDSAHALPDSAMGSMIEPVFESWFLNAARGILEINRAAGHTHEDFIESLQFYTQARSLAVARMAGIGAHTFCAAPFTDDEVLDICFRIDKSLRKDHLLMKNYLATHFPESIDFIGNNTGGFAGGNGRLKRFKQAMQWFRGSRSPVEATRQRSGRFSSSPEFQRRIDTEIKNTVRRVPDFISRGMDELWQKRCLNPILLVRYLSLNRYLNF